MKNKYFCIVAALGLEPGEDTIPEWFCIFPEGENEVEGVGSYIVDAKAWGLVDAGLTRRGVDVVFDYEHQTIHDVKAPASGWCKQWRYTPGVGIEAKVEWTAEAAAFLKKGEYRYFSPVFHVLKSDRRIRSVHSVALTNAPRTNNIKPLLAKLGADYQNEENGMTLLEQMIAKLKLDAGATEAEVIAAVAALGAAPKEVIPGAVVAALGIDETDESTVVASIFALQQTAKTVVSVEDFNTLKLQVAKRNSDEVVAKAVLDGKITPDMLPWANEYAVRDLPGFVTFVSKAPVSIPVDVLPKGQEKTQVSATSDTVLTVAKLMDIEPDDLKTFGGLE